jgi:hypothetical protein
VRWYNLTIEDAIVSRLIDEIPSLGGRIYPVSAPQKVALPYIVYKRISTVRSPTLCEQGSREVSIQFDIYGRTYPEMRSLREDLREAFEDVIGEYSPGSPYVQRAEIVNEFDGNDVGTDVTTGVIEIQFFYN